MYASFNVHTQTVTHMWFEVVSIFQFASENIKWYETFGVLKN